MIVHFADLRGEGKNEDDYEKSHSEWTCREERNTAHLDVVKPLYFSETSIPSEMRAVRLGLTRNIDLHASPVEGKTEHEKKQAKNGRAAKRAVGAAGAGRNPSPSAPPLVVLTLTTRLVES